MLYKNVKIPVSKYVDSESIKQVKVHRIITTIGARSVIVQKVLVPSGQTKRKVLFSIQTSTGSFNCPLNQKLIVYYVLGKNATVDPVAEEFKQAPAIPSQVTGAGKTVRDAAAEEAAQAKILQDIANQNKKFQQREGEVLRHQGQPDALAVKEKDVPQTAEAAIAQEKSTKEEKTLQQQTVPPRVQSAKANKRNK